MCYPLHAGVKISFNSYKLFRLLENEQRESRERTPELHKKVEQRIRQVFEVLKLLLYINIINNTY